MKIQGNNIQSDETSENTLQMSRHAIDSFSPKQNFRRTPTTTIPCRRISYNSRRQSESNPHHVTPIMINEFGSVLEVRYRFLPCNKG